MPPDPKPLILTLRMDAESQKFFDGERLRYFPPERNHLAAHLTLFHHLPNAPLTFHRLAETDQQPFNMTVSGLRHLGAGVAYQLDSPALTRLHRDLAGFFKSYLIPQDQQPLRPHVTIQNKVTPEESKQLLAKLTADFSPFSVAAVGLDLWLYLGGPWQHEVYYPFNT